MKTLKRAQQHNTQLNKDMYCEWELREMIRNGEIFYFDEENHYTPSYEPCFCEDKDLRIFLEDMKEIKVICKDGFYKNVAVNQYGKEYYINL